MVTGVQVEAMPKFISCSFLRMERMVVMVVVVVAGQSERASMKRGPRNR